MTSKKKIPSSPNVYQDTELTEITEPAASNMGGSRKPICQVSKIRTKLRNGNYLRTGAPAAPPPQPTPIEDFSCQLKMFKEHTWTAAFLMRLSHYI